MWICRTNSSIGVITCISDSKNKPQRDKNNPSLNWFGISWIHFNSDLIPQINEECYELTFNNSSNIYFDLKLIPGTHYYNIYYKNKPVYKYKSRDILLEIYLDLSNYKSELKLYISDLNIENNQLNIF